MNFASRETKDYWQHILVAFVMWAFDIGGETEGVKNAETQQQNL